MKGASVALTAIFVSACSNPHVFEVDTGSTAPDSAELTLYNATTPMVRTSRGFMARRDSRGDGSGRIAIHYPDREPIDCWIGYVTRGEVEPHKFIVENNECRAILPPP